MPKKTSTIVTVKNNYLNIADNIYFANIVKMHGMKNLIYCEIDDNCSQEVYRLLGSSFDRVILKNELNGMKNIKLISQEYSSSIISSNDRLKKWVDQTLDPFMRNSIYFRENNIVMKRTKKKKHKKPNDPYILTELICRLYDIKPEMIQKEHMNTYHLNPSTQYRPYKLIPMFDSIDCYDYMEPIKRLSKYYDGDNYYKLILEEVAVEENNKTTNLNKRLNGNLLIQPHTADLIMLEYIKCRPNTFIITIWKPAIKGVERFIEYLENYGNIYYVKQIVFSKKKLHNLMFWMYDDFSFYSRNEFISKKMESLDTEEIDNEVCFIFFDNVQSMQLSGQGAPFKKELRKKMIDILNLDPLKYSGNDIMHINDFFYQTIEYSQMILNENSLNVLDHHDNTRFMMCEKTNLMFQTFRKFIYLNFSLLEINRQILLSSMVLYQYGIRGIDLIDGLMYADHHNESKRITHLVEKHFMEKRNKFYFANIGITDSKLWKDRWTEKNKKMVNFFEASNLQNMILNPKYYSYFQGIKIFSIDQMIYQLISRNRIDDHIDMAMIHQLNPILIDRWIQFNENDDNQMYMKYLEKFETMNKNLNPHNQNIHTIINHKYPYDRKLIENSKLIKKIVALSKSD